MGETEGKKDSTRNFSNDYILDTIPNPVVEINENLIIDLANREALIRWPSIIEGKSPYYSIILNEYKKPGDCFVEKTFKLKKSLKLEIKTKKGEIFLFKTNYIKENDSHRVVIHIQDITEQKHIEEILRESEERFRALVETSSDWIWEVDLKGVYTYSSPKIKDLLGYEPEETIGKTPFDLMPSEEAKHMRAIFKNILYSEKPFERLENINKHKDNRLVILETSGVPIIDTNGNFMGYRGVDRDITERKRIVDALKKSEERYKTLVENQGEGIGLVNEQEEFLYANPAAELIFGVPPGTLAGRNLKDFLSEDNYKIIHEQTKLRQKSIKSTYEIEIIQPSGKKRTILVTATPEFDEKKRFINTFGIFRDISEQKRMQAEILKSKRFESLGFLAGGIAHDFNNLLTIIMGNIELAKRSLATENKALKFLLRLEKTVHKVEDLVERFLIFSEDKSVKIKIESIKEIIRNSTNRVLGDSNIKCSYEIPDDLWSLECNIDQLYYTITNIILNAREALSNEGKIEIKASNEMVKTNQLGTLNSGKYIKLAIKDYGAGISKEDLPRIFDPYFSTKEKVTEKGLGLGLTTIYSIIMKHMGHIHVASKLGIGTTVEIYLPAFNMHKS